MKSRLRLLLGAGILGVLVWRLGADAFAHGVTVIDGGAVAVALGIGAFTTLLSAARWSLVSRRLGLPLPLGTALADYYRALFLNAVLPAGVLGDVHRAVGQGRRAGDVGRGVRAVVLERTAGQLVLFAVAAAVLFTRPDLFGDLAPSGWIAAAVAAVLVAALVAGALSPRWRRAGRATLTDVRAGLLARDTWPAVTALSAAALAGHVGMFVVAARLAGSPATIVQLVPLSLLALLVMALPVNIGGWGPREAVTALAFGTTGLGATQGLTASVVYGVLAMIASLPGAVVLLAGALPRLAPRLAPRLTSGGLLRRREPSQDLQVHPERRDQALQKVPALAGRGQ